MLFVAASVPGAEVRLLAVVIGGTDWSSSGVDLALPAEGNPGGNGLERRLDSPPPLPRGGTDWSASGVECLAPLLATSVVVARQSHPEEVGLEQAVEVLQCA